MSQQKPKILTPEEQKEFDQFITPLIEEHKKEKESNKGSLTLLTQEQLVEKQTQLYCNKLFLSMKKWHEDNGMHPQWVTHYICVQHDKHECVEAFIDRQTGDIYKPAGWNKPAKGARYNLLDEESLQLCFKHLDPFGGHLYKNRGVI